MGNSAAPATQPAPPADQLASSPATQPAPPADQPAQPAKKPGMTSWWSRTLTDEDDIKNKINQLLKIAKTLFVKNVFHEIKLPQVRDKIKNDVEDIQNENKSGKLNQYFESLLSQMDNLLLPGIRFDTLFNNKNVMTNDMKRKYAEAVCLSETVKIDDETRKSYYSTPRLSVKDIGKVINDTYLSGFSSGGTRRRKKKNKSRRGTNQQRVRWLRK